MKYDNTREIFTWVIVSPLTFNFDWKLLCSKRIIALLMYTPYLPGLLVIHRGGLPSNSDDIESRSSSIVRGRFAEINKGDLVSILYSVEDTSDSSSPFEAHSSAQ